ncbi:MAG: hydroxyacylglutathione hydrolase [Mesorhizobium sp.]|uniref:hydroxyacylglutathione hydrolase n=1 Tax=Mesorhizobium sp. TaxID=1871066 RepID=UPI000FE4825C|nr:hydroxyacylglutathione hydrolase [Mesorhizobium sp.]RWL79723.1 MAG: hydroxyacylglutathione hydrolase [Mesorhizobium sp.]RWL84771.1 MAG: hydroxyacylglutathione hydrolase [Mesorhizobium sp.]RWL94462.1 MAG: hydroxyacylglutathione hydrolase [Mesorhizobium sp.]RWL97423.1 MAG: hydroxyacylglutathione hydrolase [Mesorhizobium sp.]TIP46953.1 MAG: hydroxyacylglutathione hydrolase [Mesorhizobium sp.]
MAVEIEQFMCRTDNFGVLVHDPKSGETAIIDAPEEAPILAAIERTGWTPTLILTTHHHADHVEANLALKDRFKLRIIGPEAEKAKIPGIDETVSQGSVVRLGEERIEVIETPGHTAGHVSYHLPASKVAFTADTLFALGCGRLFECKPPVMYESLKKLAALPAETAIYCGHEYTLANARFAVTVDPGNPLLTQRAARIEALRADNKPTLPTTIGEELSTNPFLRWHDPAIRKHLGMEKASDEEVFAEIRKRKDNF